MKTSKLKTFPRSCLRGTAILLLSLFTLAALLWLYQDLESGETELNFDKSQSFVLTNVNVLTMNDQQVLSNHAIVVRDGVITELGPMTKLSADDLSVIDGKQAYLMPGLIDAHVHVLDRSYAKSALAAGVTTVRNMGGFPYHLKWRDELEKGEWFGSRMVVSSPIFNSLEQGDPLAHFRVNDPERARQAVRDYIAEGYDFIKVYEGLHAQTYSAILAEANTLGVMVAGHPSYDLMHKNLDEHGALRTFEHSEEIYDGFLAQTFNDKKAGAAAQFFVDHNVALVPTLAVNRELTRLSNEKYEYLKQTDQAGITPFARFIYEQTSFKRWLNASPELAAYNLEVDAYLHHLTQRMHERGVTLVLGSDAGALTGLPGPATIDEIELMVAAGIPTHVALAAATINAAHSVDMDQQLGRIAVGFQADLVVLKENPVSTVQTLRDPLMVIQQGRVFDSNDLNQLRDEAHQHSNWLLSVARHLNYLLFG
ncbi:amidohydrolase family protein [Pseudidiomarina aestuarii]|uniref:amidohydrolase family protein n=1 Tax=Pseudidiomarina aestuarii TaxID=624146 RepID=UPI003A96F018